MTSEPGPDQRNGTDGGQNYLASVADLVAGLIFVFVIMLAVFAYQLAQTTNVFDNINEELRAAEETRREMLDAVAARLRGNGIRVEVLYEQGVLRLADNAVNFPSGLETPIPAHRANVGRLARAMAEVMPCYAAGRNPAPPDGRGDGGAGGFCPNEAAPRPMTCPDRTYPWRLETLLIEGHTDDVPVSGATRYRDNLELSSMRAATVHRMIAACEPAVERLTNRAGQPILSTSGYGYARPATEEPARRAENRRIDLRFLLESPDTSAGPGESPVGTDLREAIQRGGP